MIVGTLLKMVIGAGIPHLLLGGKYHLQYGGQLGLRRQPPGIGEGCVHSPVRQFGHRGQGSELQRPGLLDLHVLKLALRPRSRVTANGLPLFGGMCWHMQRADRRHPRPSTNDGDVPVHAPLLGDGSRVIEHPRNGLDRDPGPRRHGADSRQPISPPANWRECQRTPLDWH